MAFECPGCNESSQVRHLPDWWDELPKESPLRAQHGPPSNYETRYLIPAGIGAGGAAVIGAGNIVGGILLLIAAIVCWGWMFQKAAGIRAKRAEWARSKRCLKCPRTFVPSLLAEQ